MASKAEREIDFAFSWLHDNAKDSNEGDARASLTLHAALELLRLHVRQGIARYDEQDEGETVYERAPSRELGDTSLWDGPGWFAHASKGPVKA